MSKAHITIHDIARELNISASTVSRALNKHPRISEKTRIAVENMAVKLNYQPNIMASSLRQGRSKTVGMIVPRINRNFFASVIGGLEEILAASGYHLIICQSHEKLEHEVAALQTLMNARVDAIILSVSMETTNSAHLRELRDRGIRLFFFDRIIEEISAGSVVVDDRQGAYLNVRHMIKQGYEKIMHLSGADHINIYRARKQGYLDALKEAGMDPGPACIIEEPLVIEGGKNAFWKAMEEGADGIFCAGDYAALGVIQQALKEGVKIPDDLGVSGFANEPFTAFLNPPLTTVDQGGDQMGRLVAEMFLQCEILDDISECKRKVLKPELIIRESTKRTK